MSPCLVSISSLEQSSQGQALSWALPAPASPPGPSDPFVFHSHTHLPLLCCLPLILYSLSSPPPFFPSSLLSLLCPFPDCPPPLSPLWFPLLLFLLSITLSLCISIFPSLHSPLQAPTGALCVPKLCGWQPESTPPHPPNTRPAWQV